MRHLTKRSKESIEQQVEEVESEEWVLIYIEWSKRPLIKKKIDLWAYCVFHLIESLMTDQD